MPTALDWWVTTTIHFWHHLLIVRMAWGGGLTQLVKYNLLVYSIS